MREITKKCDCVVEVCDARVPLSGRNPAFSTLGLPHVIALNKRDLVPRTQCNVVKAEAVAES